MTINGKTDSEIIADVTAQNTTESDFMGGMNDIIAQVSMDEANIKKTVDISVSGAATASGSFNLQSDADPEVALALTLNANSVVDSNISGDISNNTTGNAATADMVDVHLDTANANRPLLWNQGAATPDGTARTVGANNSELSYNPSTNTLIITPTQSAIQLGGWTIVENASGGLDFNRGTDTLFRMTSTGHFHADNDITAFSGTI